MSDDRKAVLFDMGSVLIGWEVRPPFRPHFSSEAELETFLRGPFREIYDAVHDGEGSMAECLAPLRPRYPEAGHLIDLYQDRWGDFVTGVMEESVGVVHELHAAGVALFGVTNWPAQVWPPPRILPGDADAYAFLDLFADIWVSGEHKLRKPDPESYRSALRRFGLEAEEAVFVDDLEANIAAAEELGMAGVHFRDAPGMRRELVALGLL